MSKVENYLVDGATYGLKTWNEICELAKSEISEEEN